ncbi:protein archease-like [Sitophilus oryzae]|uniref:Protein archease-like n=1 Tax=Sitophilus oryzae TaxID=7048 RepID=A0A6J2YQ20_SITOR|nr:protein archease-like [Sitophilus oryzae]
MPEFTPEELALPPQKYEYLDHTADVQLHSWGNSLIEAFEQCGIAMFGYMTELESVEIKQCSEIEATGHDLESLLFHFLDELLFLFSCEPFLICSKLVITEFMTEGEEMHIKCKCYGEEFTIGKHPQGTEVKAITYSAMQIVNEPEQNNFELFVIIDI